MNNKIFFTVFMIIWILIIVLNFVSAKENFSEQENRYLAKIPNFTYKSLLDGKYAEGLDNYINDHFVGRDFWLKFNSFMQIAIGKKENNDVYIGQDGYLFEKYLYTDDEKNNLEKIANRVNEFSKKIEKPTYFMLVPNSNYIYREKLPQNVEFYLQDKIINEFYNKLDKKVKTINTIDILEKNKNDKELYFKTDHHITSLGAYLLYTEFCITADEQITDISSFDKKVVSTSFFGTLDSKAQVYNQKPDIIDVYENDINQNVEGDYDGTEYNSMFNDDYLNKKDKYSYFLNGNNAKVVIKTNINNEKKLLIIKDSYAHIFAQFICQNYEEIHFIDPRYYKVNISEYIEKNSIDEVLFLYNVSNMLQDIYLRGIKY